ncbi:hypothetical protein VPH49_23875 [Pseudomonas luteola]|uniref:hypothetical protein n=1 Tax=Pseudomonas luteola TaxID=47886 RepID=UPI00123AF0B0|nr:hypothetical protein [Pseudomonas luteola]QEU26619.1 hypothetical protein FOB45_02040 [Pseudomonas luteola]
MAEYLTSAFLIAPVVILWLVLLMPSDQELAVASIESKRERLAKRSSSRRRPANFPLAQRFLKGWLAACVLWTVLIAGITYLNWPEQTRPMPALPELLSLEHYEQAYSKGLTEDSFFEYHAAAVRKQNNILATHLEFEEGYGDRIKRLLLVVLGIWIGPCIGFWFALARVMER